MASGGGFRFCSFYGLEGIVAERAEREHSHICAVFYFARRAHFDFLERAFPLHRVAVSARVAYHECTLAGQLGGVHESSQFVRIHGRGDGYIGNGQQSGKIEHAVVRGAVFAHQAGAVETEYYRQVEQRHVVDDIIVGALGERAVDVAKGNEPVFGHAAREGNGVTFGDTHVERAVGQRFHHDVH